MTTIKIGDVSPATREAEELLEGFVDLPRTGYATDDYVFLVAGWVVCRESPVVSVSFIHDGIVLRTAKVNLERKDVAAAFPEDPSVVNSGFVTGLGSLGLAPEFEIQIEVKLQDQRRLLWRTIRGRHAMLQSDYTPALQPLLVTCLGRTGSTLLMQLLGDHPEIITQRAYVHESRYATYWAHMLKVLSEPGNYFEPADWTPHLTDVEIVRANPFHHDNNDTDLDVMHWLGTAYVKRFAAFCQQNCDELYRQEAISKHRTHTRYFAEKQFPGLMSNVIRELYPKGKEVFMIRDFRDMLCSMVSYLQKPETTFAGATRDSTVEDLIGQTRTELELLLTSWRQQSTRAHLVRYEDLVTRPNEILIALFRYLDLDAPPALLDQLIATAFKETPEFQSHRTTASLGASIGRWKRDLDPPLQEIAQEAYGDMLVEFGYH